MCHQQLILLREIFQKNGYPENFIDRCFKLFLNRIQIHFLKEKIPTSSAICPSLFGNYMSLQTRTKLQTSIKEVLHCCKLQIIFKSQNKLGNNFRFKGPVPKFSHKMLFIRFTVGNKMNPITENVLDKLL